ncbi:MAG: DUF5005 domain-containing protein [Candidatus Symbiothrix sp.]|jgi:hypothetical protein|nr:DUF5005 domain-containing protein [Candidatus Symbiothrix sp.]
MRLKFISALILSAYTLSALNAQTFTAENHSQFDLTLTWDAQITLSNDTRNLFGVLLPKGWRVADKGGDFTVSFSNGNTSTGQFAYCQFYSDSLAGNLETPAGYYWWGGRAIDKIKFTNRATFDIDFSLKILTDHKTGNFNLKFATGSDPSGSISNHFVSDPFQVSVSYANEFPAAKTYNWQHITGNFNTEYFADKDFDGYFLRYYGWNGGDVGMSTVLPDGRSIWTWGDYDVGVVNSERNRLPELNQFPRNGLTIQEKYSDFSAFKLLTNGKNIGKIEASIVYRDNAGNPRPGGDEWYWPMGGHIYYRNGVPELQILLEHTRNAGGGQWGMEGVGVDVAVFSLPDLELQRVVKDRYTGKIGFGNIAFGDDDGVVYIYGERHFGICVSATFVARNSEGDLTGIWEFYDAATGNWTTTHEWAEIDTDGWWNDKHQLLNNAIFVFKDGGKYFAFEQEPCFSPNSFVHDAASPVGPFSNRRKVGQLPADITSNNFICYIPALHQQFSKDGELLYSVSKNYNGDFDRFNNNQSANYYLPYFFRVKKWRDKLNIVENNIPCVPAVAFEYWLADEYPAMDNDANTIFRTPMQENSISITGVAPQNILLRQYTITSAPDSSEKDPLHWQLLGSADGEHWTILDERYHAVFEERGQTNSYTVSIGRTCKYFRLNVLAVNGSAELQIAEWQLFGRHTDFNYPNETAIRKTEMPDIRVYPNPATDELRIESGESRIGNVEIFDISGRKILNSRFSTLNSQLKINVCALPTGLYLLRTETESGSQVFKFNKKQ